MAINLLSLARSSAGGLHNSGRGGGKSYASGTSYGNKIAGTKIKQGAGLTDLAKKGRTFNGVKDTKIRKVAGRPSHVNTAEAKAIDSMGPLGEAWVQSIGSGTINPKTGLKEYFLKGVGDWLSGKTARRKRAAKREKARRKARHKQFESFRRTYEDQNIAGIWTDDESVDDTAKIIAGGWDSGMNSQFEDFIVNAPSGLVITPEAARANKEKAMGKKHRKFSSISSNEYGGTKYTQEEVEAFGESAATSQQTSNENDIMDYLDPYDTRIQDEAKADFDRQTERLGIQTDTAFQKDISKQQATGAQLSSGLFGLLTQAKQKTSQQNFAGAGDFAAQFEQDQIVEAAEREVSGGTTERETELKEIDIDTRQAAADFATAVQDEQDNYNQEFWQNMSTWDQAINS